MVTGASSGIGAAIAVALGAAGAKVAVNYLGSRRDAEAVAAQIASCGSHAICMPADVSREPQVRALFRDAIAALGSIDILVNNAGIQQDALLHEMSLTQWQKVIDVNLTGQFLCAREAVREFMRRGPVPQRSTATGKIICISSVHQAIPWAGHVNYAASKGGIAMMMATMAQELAPLHIRVNSIAPGAIKTDINRAAWRTEPARARLLKLIPYGRLGGVEDVARAAVWLASDDSDYVTGTTLTVDGGMMLYPAFRTGG